MSKKKINCEIYCCEWQAKKSYMKNIHVWIYFLSQEALGLIFSNQDTNACNYYISDSSSNLHSLLAHRYHENIWIGESCFISGERDEYGALSLLLKPTEERAYERHNWIDLSFLFLFFFQLHHEEMNLCQTRAKPLGPNQGQTRAKPPSCPDPEATQCNKLFESWLLSFAWQWCKSKQFKIQIIIKYLHYS